MKKPEGAFMVETTQQSPSERGTSADSAPRAILPLWLKSIYGAGNFGEAVFGNAFYLYAMLFYTDIVRLSAQLVGIALSTGRFVDALTDPLMGQISDRTYTRFGRRRPYIMFGSIFWGFVFVSVWLASPGWLQGGKFAYLIAVDILFAIGLTIFQTPYMALGAELSLDYRERSSIAAYRMAFLQIGNVLGAGMLMFADSIRGRIISVAGQTPYAMRWLADAMKIVPNAEWTGAALVLCIVSTVPMFLSGLIPKERFSSRSVRRLSLWQALKTTLSNANYRRVVAVMLLVWAATAFSFFLLPYLMIYWVGKRSLIMPAYAALAATVAVALPFWVRLGRTVEKSVVLRIACVCNALRCPLSLILFSRSHPYLAFVFAVWAGIGEAGCLTYVHSMIGDVTDEDELKTGERREGCILGCSPCC